MILKKKINIKVLFVKYVVYDILQLRFYNESKLINVEIKKDNKLKTST
jgi:hypothetical protein